MATKTKLKKSAAKGGASKSKLNTGKGKVGKAAKGKAKSSEPKLNVKVGQDVIFKGYAEQPDEPLFEKGERLTVAKVGKNDDGQQVFECVKVEDYEAYKANPEDVNGDELFATEIEKAEKLPDDPYKFELKTDDKLDTFIEEHDSDPLEAAQAAIENVASNMFLLGGCLAKLYADRKFLEYGEGEGDKNEYADEVVDGKPKVGSGWDKFCQENFDMGGRKAHGMIQIYRNYNGLSDILDLDAIASDNKIGWVKLSAAAPHISKENAEELVEAMREQNVADFKETLRTDYVDAGTGGGDTRSKGAKVRRTTVKIAWFEDQSVACEQVIDLAKKQFGTDDLGAVLERIIMEWAVTNLTDTQQKKVRSARKSRLSELKKQGVDVTERQEHLTTLEANIEEAFNTGEGDGEEEGDSE